MGSETTLPYAWLLWRFNNTLANPVTWCCRCLYDTLRNRGIAKSAQRIMLISHKGLTNCVLNVSHVAVKRIARICATARRSSNTQSRKFTIECWVVLIECLRLLSSYVLAKLSLSYPLSILKDVQERCFESQGLAQTALCIRWKSVLCRENTHARA